MPLEFADGFDSYNGQQENQFRWDLAYAAPSLGNGRYAGSGCNGSGPGNTMASTISRSVLASATTRTMGFAYKAPSSFSQFSLMQWMDGGTIQVEIQQMANGSLAIFTGGVNRAQSSNLLQAGQWCYIELYTIFGPSGPSNLYVNGGQWTGYAGANNTSGSNRATAIKFTPNGNLIDDVYVRNGDALLYGEISVVADTPSGDVSGNQQWAPDSGSTHYSRVNEQNFDADTSYVYTATANQWDLYSFLGRTLSGANTIAGVIATAIARKDDTAARNLQLGVKQGSASGGGVNALTQSYAAYQQVWETNPNNGNANWAAGDIGSAGAWFGVVSG